MPLCKNKYVKLCILQNKDKPFFSGMNLTVKYSHSNQWKLVKAEVLSFVPVSGCEPNNRIQFIWFLPEKSSCGLDDMKVETTLAFYFVDLRIHPE